jgi:hypothetical protein
MLCITGSPRMGGKYISRVMRRAGIDVGYEKMASEGIAHPFWAVDDTIAPPGWKTHELKEAHKKNRDSYDFTHRWHQLRHPLNVIPSIEARFRRHSYFWPWQEKHTGVSPEDPFRAARFWLAWTELADEWCDFRYRIEDIDAEWPGLVAKLGHAGAPLCQKLERTCNSCVHDDIEWKDLGPTEDAVRERATRYGYSDED